MLPPVQESLLVIEVRALVTRSASIVAVARCIAEVRTSRVMLTPASAPWKPSRRITEAASTSTSVKPA